MFIGLLVVVNMFVPAATSRHCPPTRPRPLLPCRSSARRSRPSRSAWPLTQFTRYLDDGDDRVPGGVRHRPVRLRGGLPPPRRPREVRLRHRPDVPVPAVARCRLPDDGRRPAHPRLRLVGGCDRVPGDASGGRRRSSCRRSSTRSPAPRTPSTRWTCAAFGTGRRTWLRQLVYDRLTDVLLASSRSSPRRVLGFAGITLEAVRLPVPHRPRRAAGLPSASSTLARAPDRRSLDGAGDGGRLEQLLLVDLDVRDEHQRPADLDAVRS